MKQFTLMFIAAALLASAADATTKPSTLDSNAAYYEGENLNYVIYPPQGYRMVIEEAKADGYSFAFVPRQEAYTDAASLIGVNIYKIRGLSFKQALSQDTLAVRKHYGKDTELRRVDSVFSTGGVEIPTFYLGNEDNFIPTVMIAYFDGGSEMLIFELVISLGAPKLKCEDLFLNCLHRFKAMPTRDLSEK